MLADQIRAMDKTEMAQFLREEQLRALKAGEAELSSKIHDRLSSPVPEA